MSLFIAGFLSLFASSHPDGYEKAGEETGFIKGATAYLPSPLPDYKIPGNESVFSAVFSGVIGVLLTYIFFLFIGKWLTKNES